MRAITKDPGKAPILTEVRDGSPALHALIGGHPGTAMTGPGVRCYCDDDAMIKRPCPPLNLERPSDRAPIHGTVVVLGEDETGEPCGMDDRQAALWMATLALCGVDELGVWRCEALNTFVPQIHPNDVAAYQRVADVWMDLP